MVSVIDLADLKGDKGDPGYNAVGAAATDASMAAFVNQASGPTLTGAAVVAATKSSYSPIGLPDGLTGTGRYDQSTGIYGIDRVPRLAMKVLTDAFTANKRILCVGHSLVGGSGGTVSWPTRLRNALSSAIPQNTGIVFATQAGSPTDSQWTIGAGWNRFSTDNLTMMMLSVAVGSTATFVSARTGTIVDIWTNGQSAPFTYQIDGGAVVTYTPTTTFAGQKVSITGLANTVHTVVIKSTTASVTYLLGVEVRQATGLSITNMGAGGSLSGQWTNATWYTLGPMSQHLGPWDLTIIEISTNDMRNNVAISTYKTNVQAMIDRARIGGGDVILCVDPQPNTVAAGSYAGVPAATSAAYRQAAYDLGDLNNIRVFDAQGFFGTYEQANADGMMFDSVHMTDAGYQRFGRAIDRVMAP